jgi:hypothetical protein
MHQAILKALQKNTTKELSSVAGVKCPNTSATCTNIAAEPNIDSNKYTHPEYLWNRMPVISGIRMSVQLIYV